MGLGGRRGGSGGGGGIQRELRAMFESAQFDRIYMQQNISTSILKERAAAVEWGGIES